MANIGQNNASETLGRFRQKIEAIGARSPVIHLLGDASLAAYRMALRDIVSARIEGRFRQIQIVNDLSQPKGLEVDYSATEQKVAMRAVILGRTAAAVTSFAIALEYKPDRQDGTDTFSPSGLSARLSYHKGPDSYMYHANWWPPFELPEADVVNLQMGAAVRANYDRGLDRALNAVEQFNTILTPMAGET